eukprot:SAG11_NODE_190_length_12980_cov_11.633802_14_plen_257_part_00
MSTSSDVLPVYLCPEMTKSSRRIQRQKGIVASALNNAYQRYDHELKEGGAPPRPAAPARAARSLGATHHATPRFGAPPCRPARPAAHRRRALGRSDLRRVSRENQLFEAELRRQTHAANELRLWRKSNLMEMRRTHESQMGVEHQKRQEVHRPPLATVPSKPPPCRPPVPTPHLALTRAARAGGGGGGRTTRTSRRPTRGTSPAGSLWTTGGRRSLTRTARRCSGLSMRRSTPRRCARRRRRPSSSSTSSYRTSCS